MSKGTKKGKRIPKTIAGVKVPKELRKAGEKLLDHAQRPETQAKIAGVLTMAAGAVAAAAAKKRAEQAADAATAAAAPHPPEPPRPGEPPRPPQPPRPSEPGTRSQPDAQAIADALGQAAEQVLGRFLGKRTRG